MSALDFHTLAEQFCAAAGAPMPDLVPDAQGAFTFSALLRDVAVTVTHEPMGSPDHVFVLVAFGPLPEEHARQAALRLLNANLLMLRAQAPAFGLNPVDEHVLLQYALPLAELTGESLLAGMAKAVDSALQWRQDFFLGDEASDMALAVAPLGESFV